LSSLSKLPPPPVRDQSIWPPACSAPPSAAPSPVARSPGETSSGAASIWLAGGAVGHRVQAEVLGGAFDLFGRAFDLDRAVLALEQGITLELGLDEGVEFEVRQLQQLDRLLKLRRDDKALALPKLQSVAESQCALLGKSTNLLIAIERPVWLTGRQRQQKAGHCDHPPGKTGVFLGGGQA
jgi:hypothetical protein